MDGDGDSSGEAARHIADRASAALAVAHRVEGLQAVGNIAAYGRCRHG